MRMARTDLRVSSHSFDNSELLVSVIIRSAFVPQRQTGRNGQEGLIFELLIEAIVGSQNEHTRESDRG